MDLPNMEKIYIKGEYSVPGFRGTDGVVHVEKTNDVSDGYHTFGELYEHRITLFIALCKTNIDALLLMEDAIGRIGDERDIKQFSESKQSLGIWRSKNHHKKDKPIYNGWFIMGIGKKEGEQITYHLPLSRWDETSFAETLEHAPKWDGHTPDDVLKRLEQL